jgi:hypothetical protein
VIGEDIDAQEALDFLQDHGLSDDWVAINP